MSRLMKFTTSLLAFAGTLPAIVQAGPPSDGDRSAAKALAPMSNEEAWRRLPPTDRGGDPPLPSWARVLAGSIPRTTAALLRVDYVHRARNPLDPGLRAEMRWVAAHANRCAYSEAYALADGRRAGLDDESIAALRRGDFSGKSPAEKAALEFARKMTVNSASVTDEEFAALVKHHGEKAVAAMVLTMAHANFQDRLVLSLGSAIEPDGPLPPLDVAFAKGALVTRPPAGAPKPPVSPAASLAAHPSGKDIIPDDPEWTSSSYDELQARLEAQRNKVTRVRVPSWEEVERGLPPGFSTPNRVIWNLVCLGHQPELAAAWETYLRTSAMETADRMDRVFGQSLFWVTTRAMNCPYCMGHCEMGLDLAGLSKPEIARRTRLLAGDDWSSFPPEEQGAYAFARKLTRTPWEISLGGHPRPRARLRPGPGNRRPDGGLSRPLHDPHLQRIPAQPRAGQCLPRVVFRHVAGDGQPLAAGPGSADPPRDEGHARGIQARCPSAHSAPADRRGTCRCTRPQEPVRRHTSRAESAPAGAPRGVLLPDGRPDPPDGRPRIAKSRRTANLDGRHHVRPVTTDRARSQHDPRLRLQDDAVLGRLPEQQLHLLHGS